uniref:Uncharacterized protein n=1 Tax=Physcomitrium patens TaxID=3218 RepID=A0A2K1LAY4_PHYPA|nr:hypothetical protein PHYPA_001598 [Physcomitrium patens]
MKWRVREFPFSVLATVCVLSVSSFVPAKVQTRFLGAQTTQYQASKAFFGEFV